MISLQSNNALLIASEKHFINLYDISLTQNQLIRVVGRVESHTQDLLVIENASGQSNYFITLILNNNVLKLTDSNDLVLGQYSYDDFNCSNCKAYFNTHTLGFLSVQDGKLKLIFSRHRHHCKHHDEKDGSGEGCEIQSTLYV